MSRKNGLLRFLSIFTSTLICSCREIFETGKNTFALSQNHSPLWQILIVAFFGISGIFLKSFLERYKDEKPVLAYSILAVFVLAAILCIIFLPS
jgi:hypothetical protein